MVNTICLVQNENRSYELGAVRRFGTFGDEQKKLVLDFFNAVASKINTIRKIKPTYSFEIGEGAESWFTTEYFADDMLSAALTLNEIIVKIGNNTYSDYLVVYIQHPSNIEIMIFQCERNLKNFLDNQLETILKVMADDLFVLIDEQMPALS